VQIYAHFTVSYINAKGDDNITGRA